jgi:hypothetical protein
MFMTLLTSHGSVRRDLGWDKLPRSGDLRRSRLPPPRANLPTMSGFSVNDGSESSQLLQVAVERCGGNLEIGFGSFSVSDVNFVHLAVDPIEFTYPSTSLEWAFLTGNL